MKELFKQLLPLYVNLIGGILFLIISVVSMVKRRFFRLYQEHKNDSPSKVKMHSQILDLKVPIFYGLIFGSMFIGLYLMNKPIPLWFGVLNLCVYLYSTLRLLFPRTGSNAGRFFE
ncbi:MAG: hypothetical protein NTY07_11730 [Bacteroidia bacterium]|nr:hypothetical protein [Bacteroidia bacterium]